MSSKTSKEEFQVISNDHLSKNRPINIKELTIPFSRFVEINPSYIYSGKEKIPFNKRHPEYQTIFRNEFAGELRRFFDNRRNS